MEKKISEIWWWMGMSYQHENGVTNEDVVSHFGDDYSEAWRMLKQRSRRSDGLIFHENGKWFRWFKN